MSGPFAGSVCDIWEPLERTNETTGDVLSASHEPTYKGVTCRLVPLSSREKLTAGIDVSARMKRLYVRAGRIAELSNDAVVVDVTSKGKPEYWSVQSEVEVYPFHLECVLEELEEGPDMIGQFYG